MLEPNDPLGGEFSIEVQLRKTGLEANAKSRAIAALDRLCGNALDIIGSYLEAIPERRRAKTNVEVELIKAEGIAAIKKLELDPSFGGRTIDVFLQEQVRKQSNRDAVAHETLEALEETPPTQEESQLSISMDDDWLNIFSAYAEKASSDHLRNLWGRILAGEIRKPKSFSLRTLRAISELDREIAEIYQNAVKTRWDEYFLPKPKDLTGEVLMNLTLLEEAGLLQDVTGMLCRDYRAESVGYIIIKNGTHILRVKSNLPKIQIPIIKITRIGKEIASILPPEPNEIALRAVATSITELVGSMELGIVEEHYPDGSFKYNCYESLT